MKNELLLSTILLMNPVSNVSAQEINSVKERVVQGLQHLAELTFESPSAREGVFYRWNSELDEVVEIKRLYKRRVSFVISREVETSDYTYNGHQGEGEMDYQVIIDSVDAETGEILKGADSVFFAKRLSKNKFRLYNCDSTSTCDDYDDGNYRSFADFYVFNTPEGRILKSTQNSRHDFDEYVFEDTELWQSK